MRYKPNDQSGNEFNSIMKITMPKKAHNINVNVCDTEPNMCTVLQNAS